MQGVMSTCDSEVAALPDGFLPVQVPLDEEGYVRSFQLPACAVGGPGASKCCAPVPDQLSVSTVAASKPQLHVL